MKSWFQGLPSQNTDPNTENTGTIGYWIRGQPYVSLAGVDGASVLVGVSATTGVGVFGFTTGATAALTGIAATAHAGSLSITANGSVLLAGTFATAAVGHFGFAISSAIALVGVSSAATIGTITPNVSHPIYVPLITIMNDLPIPIAGDMMDDPTPMEADLPYQVALDTAMNSNPIPMTGQMYNNPIPGEGSVP